MSELKLKVNQIITQLHSLTKKSLVSELCKGNEGSCECVVMITRSDQMNNSAGWQCRHIASPMSVCGTPLRPGYKCWFRVIQVLYSLLPQTSSQLLQLAHKIQHNGPGSGLTLHLLTHIPLRDLTGDTLWWPRSHLTDCSTNGPSMLHLTRGCLKCVYAHTFHSPGETRHRTLRNPSLCCKLYSMVFLRAGVYTPERKKMSPIHCHFGYKFVTYKSAAFFSKWNPPCTTSVLSIQEWAVWHSW